MKRRLVTIDGDDYEVLDAGNWFIETNRKRYSWDEGEFRYSPDRTYPPDVLARRVKPLSNRTGRDIVLITLRGCTAGTCWITWSDGMRAVYNAPKVEAVTSSVSVPKSQRKPTKQRRHGPDNRKSYNRRKNPDLGNQLCAFFRNPANKDASINAGAKWAESLFDRKGGENGRGGILSGFKLPCSSVLWREAKKQKGKVRYQR